MYNNTISALQGLPRVGLLAIFNTLKFLYFYVYLLRVKEICFTLKELARMITHKESQRRG